MLRMPLAGARLLPLLAHQAQVRMLVASCSRPNRPDLRKLAELAQISVTDAEV